jgi:tetratricopeptide (TPR) repeat protein
MRAATLALLLFAAAGVASGQAQNETTSIDAPTGGWGSCADIAHRRTAEQEIAACTRVLDNTEAEMWRGAAFWWRGVAHKRADQADEAAADFASAFAAYTRYIETTPRSSDAYFQRAQLLAYLRRYDEALQDYDAADRIAPNQAASHYGRGSIAFSRGDYALAMREFDVAQRNARLRSSSGALHMTDGAYSGRRFVGESFDQLRCAARAAAGVDLAEAAQICDRAVRESDGDPDALMSRGFLRFKQGQAELARADFSAALGARPDFAGALLGQGVTRLRAGDSGGAADIERARRLDAAAVTSFENAGLRAP